MFPQHQERDIERDREREREREKERERERKREREREREKERERERETKRKNVGDEHAKHTERIKRDTNNNTDMGRVLKGTKPNISSDPRDEKTTQRDQL